MARSGPMGKANQESCLRRFRPRLREAMRASGLNESELAEMVDMTRPAISMYLSGRRIPETVSLIRLCRALDISADYLLGLSGDPWVLGPSP